METTGICDMGLSPTLMAGQDEDNSQESLSLEADIVKNCSVPYDDKDEEGVDVVQWWGMEGMLRVLLYGNIKDQRKP